MNKTGFTICKHFPVPVFICRLSQYLPPCSSARPASLSCIHRHARLRARQPFRRSHTLPRPERPHSFPAPAAFLPAMLLRQKHKNAKNTKNTKKDAVPQPVSQSSDFYSDFPGNTSPGQRPFYIFFSECPQPAVAQVLRRSAAQSRSRSSTRTDISLFFRFFYLSSFPVWTTDGRFYAARSSPASPSPRRR